MVTWDDYWKKFKVRETRFEFEVNRWILISLLLVIAVIALAYFNIRTGSYLRLVEKNTTEILNNLSLCYSEKESLALDLETCNSNLESKSLALTNCQREKNRISESLSECEDDLDSCKDDYKLIEESYDTCKDDLEEFEDFLDDNNLDDVDDLRDKWRDMKSDLSDCQNDLSSCQDDLGDCNNNYTDLLNNYAKGYCCLLNQTFGNITSYRVSDNKVVCTNSTSDTALVC